MREEEGEEGEEVKEGEDGEEGEEDKDRGWDALDAKSVRLPRRQRAAWGPWTVGRAMTRDAQRTQTAPEKSRSRRSSRIPPLRLLSHADTGKWPPCVAARLFRDPSRRRKIGSSSLREQASYYAFYRSNAFGTAISHLCVRSTGNKKALTSFRY